MQIVQWLLLAAIVTLFVLVLLAWVGYKIDDYCYYKKIGKKKERKDL